MSRCKNKTSEFIFNSSICYIHYSSSTLSSSLFIITKPVTIITTDGYYYYYFECLKTLTYPQLSSTVAILLKLVIASTSLSPSAPVIWLVYTLTDRQHPLLPCRKFDEPASVCVLFRNPSSPAAAAALVPWLYLLCSLYSRGQRFFSSLSKPYQAQESLNWIRF